MKTIRIHLNRPVIILLFIAVGVLFSRMWFQLNTLHQEYDQLLERQKVISAQISASKDSISKCMAFRRVIDAFYLIGKKKMEKTQLVATSEELLRLSSSLEFDPLLVVALVGVESQGNPRALGRYRSGELSGAKGLMQIKGMTAHDVVKQMNDSTMDARQVSRELLNPEVNILVGTAYLMQLIHKFKDLKKGIMAYNIGPAGLRLALKGKKKLPLRYYNRVLSNYRDLVKNFGDDPLSEP